MTLAPVRPRRVLAAVLTVVTCTLRATGPASARELSDQEVLEILTTEQPRDRSIRKALEWIRKQQIEDGSLSKRQHRTAMTSFGVMAHLAAGHTFEDHEFGEWMVKSLRFVLKMQDKAGYFGRTDNSRMYGHGVTTLMLAEALGMVEDPELEEAVRKALERAITVTINAARVKKNSRDRGGWRYNPDARDSDLSLSGWQLMSLHAAQQVGITVPKEIVKNALDYAKRLTDSDGKVGYDGRGQDKPALRGLGMLCFAIAGEVESDTVTRIAERIQRDPIDWRGPWFFYRVYYDAVGMSRARPDLWEQYSERLEGILIKNQKDDGSWPSPPGDNERSHGPVYVTSMAVLALAVDRHVLPVYQR
ncbi:MAG: prenyltransferase/squalene oxidase repeat-containing protein [Planctomycetota bacterium]|jgi:hypothetical protein